MESVLINILLYALPMLFALTLHEAAHAYVADYFGDPTPRSLGRLSLNPAVHIDPFGTVVLPILLYLGSHGNFFMGYAKTPVNFSKLRNPKKQMGWVSLAGPAANLAMAWGWQVWGDLLMSMGVSEPYFLKMATGGVQINLFLCVLNLIPLPPLDGGRVLLSWLPTHWAVPFGKIEPYGFLILMVLMITDVLSLWMKPMLALTGGIIHFLTSPFSFFLN
jgi:Zn-dependent protease